MRVSIGGIFAKCLAGGCNDFAPSRPLQRSDLLACARCCNHIVYEELLAQIGREAVARVKAARPDPRRASTVPDDE